PSPSVETSPRADSSNSGRASKEGPLPSPSKVSGEATEREAAGMRSAVWARSRRFAPALPVSVLHRPRCLRTCQSPHAAPRRATMTQWAYRSVFLATGLALLAAPAHAQGAQDGALPRPAAGGQRPRSFLKDVLPIFEQSCQKCHRGDTAQAGLKL